MLSTREAPTQIGEAREGEAGVARVEPQPTLPPEVAKLLAAVWFSGIPLKAGRRDGGTAGRRDL